MPLALFHLKVASLLLLAYCLTFSKAARGYLIAYAAAAVAAWYGMPYLQRSGGIAARIGSVLAALPDAFRSQLAFFNRWYPTAVAVMVALVVARIVFVRHVGPKVEAFIHRHVRVRADSKKGGNLDRVPFRLDKVLSFERLKGPEYLVGLNSKGKPVWTDESALTHGTQVVGPPGTGKSVLLFNYAVQCIEKNRACCFVDGKGDMSFIHMLQAYFRNPRRFEEFLFFTPTSPEQSHSYNPLASIHDPGELADLLAVGLNLNVPGPGKVYSDTQKAYLLLLFNLFLNTGKKFNFIDILTFTNYPEAREHVYAMVGERHLVDDMEQFFRRLKTNEPELLGLTTLIQKLFCADPELSRVLNVYASDIVVKDVLNGKRFCLFSLSSGKKAETNEALAKMVIADVANAVGERMGRSSASNDFAMLILDEFGQYAPTGTFDKFISTARGSNVGCVLSHQSNAQLTGRDGIDRLAPIVRECTSTTALFRQSEEADFWARVFGTQEALKRTDVIEEGDYLTERRANKGSLRATEEFLIHPNALKRLETGQVAFRTAGGEPDLISIGMFDLGTGSARLAPVHVPAGEGLDLRKVISGGGLGTAQVRLGEPADDRDVERWRAAKIRL